MPAREARSVSLGLSPGRDTRHGRCNGTHPKGVITALFGGYHTHVSVLSVMPAYSALSVPDMKKHWHTSHIIIHLVRLLTAVCGVGAHLAQGREGLAAAVAANERVRAYEHAQLVGADLHRLGHVAAHAREVVVEVNTCQVSH